MNRLFIFHQGISPLAPHRRRPKLVQMGKPVQPPPPYRSLPGLSNSTFYQTASPVPAVPRGGCPAYGGRQLAALPGPSESTFHQMVSSAPSVPRGGCPAYGRRQLAALPGPSDFNFHQMVSSVPSVPRGGCPACGEKTARRAGWLPLSLHGAIVQARNLRSLHIERACVRPFSASSVDFPRRLCNGGEHSSPRAPPEAPC